MYEGGIKIGELQKLKSEVAQAHSGGVLDEDVTIDAEYKLTKAIAQVKKEPPNEQIILSHISNARTLLESIGAATGLPMLSHPHK